jgi:dTDP-4-dehydrorhamnose 3,5-epimerase
MKIYKTTIPGLLRIEPFKTDDGRGSFVKVFHETDFVRGALATGFVEEYYTISRSSVLRGLHFQLPPHDHVKLVCCMGGKVLDVILDVRKGSPTFGKHEAFELSGEHAGMLYIPSGMAHGFYVLEAPAIMLYKVTTVYSPDHDSGIRWDSAGIVWPDSDTVMSERDRSLPRLADFDSPFRFGEGTVGVR